MRWAHEGPPESGRRNGGEACPSLSPPVRSASARRRRSTSALSPLLRRRRHPDRDRARGLARRRRIVALADVLLWSSSIRIMPQGRIESSALSPSSAISSRAACSAGGRATGAPARRAARRSILGAGRLGRLLRAFSITSSVSSRKEASVWLRGPLGRAVRLPDLIPAGPRRNDKGHSGEKIPLSYDASRVKLTAWLATMRSSGS